MTKQVNEMTLSVAAVTLIRDGKTSVKRPMVASDGNSYAAHSHTPLLLPVSAGTRSPPDDEAFEDVRDREV